MYPQGTQTQPLDNPLTPALKALADSMTHEIEMQQNYLARIECKLHDIFNLREPAVKNDSQVKEPNITDFTQFLDSKVATLARNNAWLAQIENHLNRIV